MLLNTYFYYIKYNCVLYEYVIMKHERIKVFIIEE